MMSMAHCSNGKTDSSLGYVAPATKTMLRFTPLRHATPKNINAEGNIVDYN
jgi:hypothetical protein